MEQTYFRCHLPGTEMSDIVFTGLKAVVGLALCTSEGDPFLMMHNYTAGPELLCR